MTAWAIIAGIWAALAWLAWSLCRAAAKPTPPVEEIAETEPARPIVVVLTGTVLSSPPDSPTIVAVETVDAESGELLKATLLSIEAK